MSFEKAKTEVVVPKEKQDKCKEKISPEIVKTEKLKSKAEKSQTPWKLLGSLNRTQALTFACAFLGWALVAFNFHILAFALPYIAKDFNQPPSIIAITTTITLLTGPIGALFFGLAADKWGRKIPFMLNILLYTSTQLASGFAPNYPIFVLIRSIFGLALGGEWGLSAALAMEALPSECRGIFSGILQAGYSTGYLLSAVFYYAIISNFGWRAVYWIGSFPAILIPIVYFFVPESKIWQQQQEAKKQLNQEQKKSKLFSGIQSMTKKDWRRFGYMMILMSFFAFIAHATLDMNPTFLKEQIGLTPGTTAIISIIACCGAITGGTTGGYFSQYWGRRRTIIISTMISGCFIPLWVLPRIPIALTLGFFGLRAFAMGAFGVIPAHLNELSPPSMRGTLPGLTYQIGNMVAAPSAQIIAALGERFPDSSGKANYGMMQALLTLISMLGVIIATALGKEAKDIDFDNHITITKSPKAEADEKGLKNNETVAPEKDENEKVDSSDKYEKITPEKEEKEKVDSSNKDEKIASEKEEKVDPSNKDEKIAPEKEEKEKIVSSDKDNEENLQISN
ncbi:hypothetical protein G9A89_019629 [Geosiphon pyriformis]|nr:hypothetical protein G9A89_019629 [Geosiphon pyriformis]